MIFVKTTSVQCMMIKIMIKRSLFEDHLTMKGYKEFQINHTFNSCINPFNFLSYFFRSALVVDYLRNKIDNKIDNSRFS